MLFYFSRKTQSFFSFLFHLDSPCQRGFIKKRYRPQGVLMEFYEMITMFTYVNITIQLNQLLYK